MSTATKEKTDLVTYEDENQIAQIGRQIRQAVDETKITSRDKYVEMVSYVKTAKAGINGVKEFFEPHRRRTYEAYNGVLEDIRRYSKPFAEAERIGKQRMKGWEQIEAKRQAEAERKQREKMKAAEEAGKPAPTVAPPENKARTLVQGVTYSDNWKGQVSDFEGLLKAVLAGKAPKTFVAANESEINKFAKATKGKVGVPGIEWYNDRIASVSTK